jgi:two-component system chemotaxis response regulator CheB
LCELVGGLPSDLPAAVFVVLHLPAGGSSLLPPILDRAGPLPAQAAVDGARIDRGRIYVAPPDCHLTLEDGVIRALGGPKENGHRPAIDPLFRSAAEIFGPRAVGVVLSGALDDGTLGLRTIKTHGGRTIVQDPETALHTGMPRSAIRYVAPDRVLSPEEIAAEIVELARQPIGRGNNRRSGSTMDDQERVAKQASEAPQPGEETGLTCPECGGAIWQSDDEGVVSFRCRIGHAFAAETFLVEQAHTVEASLWAGLRLLEERAVLMRRLAERFRSQPKTSAGFEQNAAELETHAAALTKMLRQLTASANHHEVLLRE